MLNIIFSFFILAIFSNIKAASFQGTNNSSPKPIAYYSVAQATILFANNTNNHILHLKSVNDILGDESKNIKYTFEDNDNRYFKKMISKNRTSELQIGTSYFVTYIKANIKHLFSQYIDKYDFENKYDDNLKKLAKDLKTLIYDPFKKRFGQGLIKYENEPKDDQINKRTKKIFNVLMQFSDMKVKGYFIKMRKDGTDIGLCKNKSLYFNININKNDANVTHEFTFPTLYIAKLVSKPIGKS
ncbi:Protein of unknown function (DUF3271), putative [Plasmodium chabaudi adami]|uniref:Fam-d protein n=1 Tax=Plasmodium chabaudi adami TaxID=5826 RepID=A0A1C6WIA5_PLACE|nr:Protein of unknown function (DUF3271), putative [Plasmodium chabaudi adami]